MRLDTLGRKIANARDDALSRHLPRCHAMGHIGACYQHVDLENYAPSKQCNVIEVGYAKLACKDLNDLFFS